MGVLYDSAIDASSVPPPPSTSVDSSGSEGLRNAVAKLCDRREKNAVGLLERRRSVRSTKGGVGARLLPAGSTVGYSSSPSPVKLGVRMVGGKTPGGYPAAATAAAIAAADPDDTVVVRCRLRDGVGVLTRPFAFASSIAAAMVGPMVGGALGWSWIVSASIPYSDRFERVVRRECP